MHLTNKRGRCGRKANYPVVDLIEVTTRLGLTHETELESKVLRGIGQTLSGSSPVRYHPREMRNLVLRTLSK